MKAGRITIDLSAGTAQFVVDMEKANAKLKDFSSKAGGARDSLKKIGDGGHAAVTGVQATSAALRTLEGSITNNLRAAERFLANTLNLGGILQKAFPVVGAVALGGVLTELVSKASAAYEAFKKMKEAPETISNEFRKLALDAATANDELRVTNDRLALEIAKLEGKPQNGLKLALDEALKAADDLAKALDRDNDAVLKLLKEQHVGMGRQLLGESPTQDIEDQAKAFDQRIKKITDNGRQAIEAAANVPEIAGLPVLDKHLQLQVKNAAQTRLNTDLTAAYSEELKRLNAELRGAQTPGAIAPQSRIAALEGLIDLRQRQLDATGQRAASESLKEKKTGLEERNANEALTRPYTDRLKALDAQLAEVKAKASAIGLDQTAQVAAKAFAEATKAIAEVNKELEKNHIHLSAAQKQEILHRENLIQSAIAEAEWKQKLDQTTNSLTERITAVRAMTAAIGQGYAAQKAATVEGQVRQTLGEKANDPAWMRQHAGDVDKLRAQFAAEFDAQQTEQSARRVDQLSDQIDLEKELAAAELLGAEAVRQATLAYNARKLARDLDADSAKKLAEAEKQLSDAQAGRRAQSDLARLNQEIEATERLTAAQAGGAEALRKAQLENRIAEIRRNTPAEYQDAEIRKAQQLSQAQHQQEVLANALKTGIEYQNRLDSIDEQVAALEKFKAEQGDTLAIEISLRTLEQERAKIFADQVSVIGTARDGMRAFFAEMATDGVSSAKVVHDTLKNAFDSLNDTLARLLSGQRVSWASFFQSISAELAKVSLRNLEAQIAQRISRAGQNGGQPTTVAGRIGRRIGDIFHFPGGPSAPKNGLRDGQSPGTAYYVTGVSQSGQPALFSQPTAGNPETPISAPISLPAGPVFSNTSFGRPTLALPEGATDDEIPLPNRSVIAPGTQPNVQAPSASFGSNLAGIGMDLGMASLGLLTMLFNQPKDHHFQPGNPYTIPSWGGYRASGGPVDPGSAYMIGENGPEIWSPPAAGGSVIPNSALEAQGSAAAGGNVYIDARNSDPRMVEQRVKRGMQAAHNTSVRTSFKSYVEYGKRTPEGAK